MLPFISDFKVDNVTGKIYTSALFINKLNPVTFYIDVSDGFHVSYGQNSFVYTTVALLLCAMCVIAIT